MRPLGAPWGPSWLVGPEKNSRLSPPVYGPDETYRVGGFYSHEEKEIPGIKIFWDVDAFVY